MTIKIRLFATYREAAGASRLDLEVRSGATVAEALASLSQRFPRLTRLEQGMLAVNQEYVAATYPLHDGDELALIPPVSGGANDAISLRQ
ncbi:MAG: molybdopterin converting factor subunit 1 [Chloroflexota bacterium]